ncbi:lanthionine synthetase LanC family protein [Pedobacter sp. UYP1]|uniref:lanthionine synthetase LanC family protein n=1 Tax=Pedobacter sp. UYP1 TaxID=1756396 RepID=UPI00339A3045
MKQNEISGLLDGIIKEIDENTPIFSDASIEYGKMGASLFYYYCEKYFDDQEFLKKGELMIEESINILSDVSINNEYKPKYKGDSVAQTLSSFGKGLLFIQNNFDHHYDFSEYHLYLTDVLHETVKQAIDRKDFDYFSGSLAGGYYFLNKYKHDRDSYSKQVLNEIVTSIINSAIVYNEREVYWTSPTYDNQIYLGLSHGSAMIINFLTKTSYYGIYGENCTDVREVMYKAISFVMNRKRNLINGFFPYRFPQPDSIVETQFSMCYGDLGILFAVHNAIKQFKFHEFTQITEQMLVASSLRKLDSSHTQDSSILYGCSGLFHVFSDLFNKTSSNIYYETSRYWYNQIPDYWTPNKKTLAGFQFEYEDNLEIHPSAKYSFFWGIAGIGITLMHGNNRELPILNELLLTGI